MLLLVVAFLGMTTSVQAQHGIEHDDPPLQLEVGESVFSSGGLTLEPEPVGEMPSEPGMSIEETSLPPIPGQPDAPKVYRVNAETCNNGIDDDADGLIDCYDSDCNGSPLCANFFYGNNAACTYMPGTSQFSMVPKWRTDSLRHDVYSTVTPVSGDIDNDGTPEVLAYSHNGLTGGSAGPGNKIYIINGLNGVVEDSLIMPVNAPAFQSSGLAMAELDGDGFGEVVVIGSDSRLYCFEHTGAIKWTSNALVPALTPVPGIADFNQDGNPEVYVSNFIFNGQTGVQIGAGAFPPGGAIGAPLASGGLVPLGMTVAADVLPTAFCADCGGLELVAGDKVFSVNVATNTLTVQVGAAFAADGFTSIADYDKDGDLDAIVATDAVGPGQTLVYVWDIQTNAVIATSPVFTSATFWTIGQVNVGDFDGDGLVEVGVVTEDVYRVLDDHTTGLAILWSKTTNDESGFTTSVLFDFQGDGNVEVVYQDEDSLFVYEGATGNTIGSQVCRGGTVMNHPIILDVDGDDQTEIVAGCSEGIGVDPRLHGYITAFGPSGDAWVNARSVWNQSSYFITNVNDDLTIPIQQQQHHIVGDSVVINGFNIQATALKADGTPNFAATDAAPIITNLDLTNCGMAPNTIDVTIQVDNLSSDAVIPRNTPVALYNGDPSMGGATLIDTVWIPVNVPTNGSTTLMITIPDQGGNFTLYAVANDTGHTVTPVLFPTTGVGECNFLNNFTFSAVTGCMGMANDNPPVAVNDAASAPVNSPGITIDVLANDTDADLPNDSLITSTIATAPLNGTASINPNGTINYIPNTGFSGTDSLLYTVCDTALPVQCSSAWVFITVSAVTADSPPVAVNDTVATVEDTTGIDIDVLANDTDPDLPTDSLVTTTIVTNAANGTATINPNGTVNYVPNANFNGLDSLQYSVCDTASPVQCDTAWVFVNVAPVSDAPVAVNDTLTTVEDTTGIDIDVLANDSDPDAPNDSLVTTTIVTNPPNGTATINPNGTVNYVPNSDFTGIDSLQYSVCDTALPVQCDTAWIFINVTPVADPPVAVNDTVGTVEDTTGIDIDVLANDGDPDLPNDSLVTTTIVTNPANGTASINPNGTVNYIPNANFNGLDSLQYSVCDTALPVQCDTAWVFINVAPVGDAPVAVNDTLTAVEDTTGIDIDVLANDSDPDAPNDSLVTTTIVTNPPNGTATINPNGTVNYVPNSDFTGIDSLQYSVCDTALPVQCDTAWIFINVTPVADPPVAVNDTVGTVEDTTGIDIDVLANDGDPDLPNDSLVTTTIVTNPANGTASINPNGTVNYVPNGNFNGLDSLQYSVCDTALPVQCDTAWVFINVAPVGDPPVAVNDTVGTVEDTTGIDIDVLANDGDPDLPNDSLVTTTIVTNAANGTATINPNGTVNYIPNGNFSGLDSLQYSVCDTALPVQCDTAWVFINVAPVSDPPVAVNDTVGTVEDTTGIDIDVLANDGDPDLPNDSLVTTTIVTNPANGTASINPNGTVNYIPNGNFNGLDSLQYSVCDTALPVQCDTAWVFINVAPVGDPPVAVNDTVGTVEDTTGIDIDVLVNDTDIDLPNDSLITTTIVTNATNGTATINPNGTVNYIPNANFNGLDSLQYSVCDTALPVQCDTAWVFINVAPVTDPPIAVNDTVGTVEDTTGIDINVLANDGDPDLPNDSLVTTTIVTNPANGTATINPNGTVNYIPNGNFNGLDSLQYSVCDTALPVQCDTAWVFINVAPVSDPPVAVNDTVGTVEDTTSIDIDVLANDGDPDLPNDSLVTTTIVTNPTNGTATINPNGTVNYIPNGNFNGLDSLQYSVCDTALPVQCDTAWVFINVAPVGDPPVAVNDTVGTVEDTTGIDINVLANDGDPDLPNDSLVTTTIVTNPANGTATINPNGTVNYIPNGNFNGLDSLQYSVCDTALPVQCDTAWVFINVAPVSDPPVAVNDTVGTVEDTTGIDIDVLANDTDIDLPNDSLITTTIVTNATNGTATINPNGTVNYIPNANFNGLDSLQYSVCDTALPVQCDTAWVFINVAPVTDPPVAVNDTVGTVEDTTGIDIDVLANDGDPDLPNDSLVTTTIVTNPGNGTATINPNGTVNYIPNGNFSGLDSLQYSVCDTALPVQCDTAWVFINVAPVSDPPVAVNDTVGTVEDTTGIDINVLANDGDPDLPNDSLVTTTIVTNPTNGAATINPNGTVNYIPNGNFNGLDSLQYSVCDTALPVQCDTAWVFINVAPVSDPPVAVNDTVGTVEDTTGIDIDVLANDGDPDLPNDSLVTTMIVTTPTNGTATINPNGTVNYIPNGNFNGLDSLQYSVCDTALPVQCDTAWVFINVAPVSDPPVAVNDTIGTVEDTTGIDIDVLANDGDPDLPNDSLVTTTIVTNPTNGTATINPNGTVNYIPNGNFNGLDSLQYSVCDTALPVQCDTAWVFIDVAPVSDPPVAVNDTVGTVEDTTGIDIDVLANDGDPDLPNDSLVTTMIVTNPTNGTATINPNGTVNYIPNGNFNGLDSLQYSVCDTALPVQCDTAWVFINVAPVSDPPVAVNDTIGTVEDTTGIDIDVLANDGDPDLPNDSLVTTTIVTNPANGTASINPNGTVNYIPNANFNGLDSLQYSVCDTALPVQCDTAWVFIDVAPVSDPPVAVNDTVTIPEDTAGIDINVLVNDTDIDLPNDSLVTTTIVTNPGNGTASINPNGTINYVPNGNFNGIDSLQYSICDTALPVQCDTAWVLINVTPVSDPPVAVNDTIGTVEDTTGIDIDVLANDGDPDLPNDSLVTTTIVTNPANGTASINPNGTVNYIPNANFNGLDSLQYSVCDTALPVQCDTAWVFIDVAPVSDPPVAVNDTVTIPEDTAGIDINVLVNDTDIDLPNDSLVTTTIVTNPTNGTASINPNGTINYVPNGNFNGIDSLQYSICDTALPVQCDTAWVLINVTPVSDPPVAVNDTIGTVEDTTGIDIDVLANDGDPDLPNDSLVTTTIVTNPANGMATINPNGTVNYIPNANFNGLDSLQYSVCDTALPVQCDTAWVFIDVAPVSDPPVAVNDTVTIPEDTAGIDINVLVNDTDIDLPNDSLITTTIVTNPGNGTASINPNGTINYVPNGNFNGIDSLQYSICDTALPVQCDTAWVIINVTPVSDPPVAVNDTIGTVEDTTGIDIDVLANDGDPDLPNDSLVTTTIVTNPANGMATINPNGTVNYIPNANFNGLDSLQYSVCDTALPVQCDTAWVFIDVAPVSDPPVAVNDTVTIPEDTAGIDINVLVNDTDIDLPNDSLVTTTIVTNPGNGTASINPNGTINYVPNGNFNGLDSLQYSICDTALPVQCDTAWVIINVTPVSDPPVAVNDTIGTVEDTTGIDIDVLANDGDPDLPNDSLVTTTIVTNPANGTASINPNGTVNYIPNANFNGLDSLQYSVCDTALPVQCDTAWVFIDVAPVSDPPVAVNDTVTIPEDTAGIDINVLVNDTDIDLPNDSLITTTIVTNPGNGTASINPNGTINYVPNGNFNGIDSLQYSICDTALPVQCDTAWVIINVTPVSDPPVAVNDTIGTVEDTTGIDIDVLANDGDPDLPNDSLVTTTIVTNPANGTASINPNGTVNYIPNANFNGLDSLQYSVCDTALPVQCDTAWVFINVAPVSDPPVAVNDTVTIPEDTAGIDINVLVNDNDPDLPNDSLVTTTIVTNPTNGTASINPNGTINYVPNGNFNGIDSLQYSICDTALPVQCDTAWVLINVTPVSDPPVAVNDTIGTVEDTTGIDIDVLANDTDPDLPNDSLVTTTIVTNPANGMATINPNGTINYIPNANFNGLDSLQYSMCDTALPVQCDTAWVFINVAPVSDPPVAVNDTVTIPEDTSGIDINVLVNDSDPDLPNDSLIVTNIVTLPPNGMATINPNGTINYIPNTGFNGLDSLQYVICDTALPVQCDTAWVYINVLPVNDPPVAVDDSASTNEDTPVVIVPINNDTDVDGGIDSTSVTVLMGPSNGTFTVGANGDITYTPNPDFCGMDTMQYSVCDLGTPLPALCDTAWIFIDVICVNDLPVAMNDSIVISNDTPGVDITVLINDTDPDGDSLIVTAIPCPASNGTATITAGGNINYVPNPGFVGMDTICYVVCDTGTPQGCDTAFVYITVTDANDPPVAVDDSTSTPQGTLVLIDVQGNDVDPNGNPLTTTEITCDPANGMAWIVNGDSIIYVPNATFVGMDTLCYVICDNATPPECDTAIVVITVTSVNNPPVGSVDSVSVTGGSVVIVPILFNDNDPDGDSLTVTELPCSPANGVVTLNGDGSINYEPANGYVGVDSFCYVICDNGVPVLCDTVWVYVDVRPEDGVIIPNGFTPNGDGDNETFVIPGIEDFPNNELLIFNRWGNEVYREQGYLNQWGGTWDKNGEPLPDGTYYYLLDLNDGSRPRSGYLVIFR